MHKILPSHGLVLYLKTSIVYPHEVIQIFLNEQQNWLLRWILLSACGVFSISQVIISMIGITSNHRELYMLASFKVTRTMKGDH